MDLLGNVFKMSVNKLLIFVSGFSKWEAARAQLYTASIGLLGALITLFLGTSQFMGKAFVSTLFPPLGYLLIRVCSFPGGFGRSSSSSILAGSSFCNLFTFFSQFSTYLFSFSFMEDVEIPIFFVV